jgi:hypothetical protein
LNIYYWANDRSFNTGEGIQANQFINEIQKYNPSLKLISINRNTNIKNNLIGKYITPFYGVIKIWQHALLGRKTCFINYLPLWNFIIFLLLPKKTILGPITGTIVPRKYNTLLSIFKIISVKIISIKFNKILFSTNFFINYFKNKSNLYCNFIFSEFRFNKIKLIKKYDFVIYNRRHSTKGNDFIIRIIELLSNNKLKIAVIGDQIKNIKNIKNFGYIKREFTKKIISQSKYSLASAENLYSFFTQDCLSENLTVFYNDYFKNYCHFFKDQLIPLNYSNADKSFNDLKKKISLIRNNRINKNINFDIFFKNYFKDLI